MKLKNREMSFYLDALNNVAGKVNGMLAYAVARNIRKIGNEVGEYICIKNSNIEKYGELGDDGVSRIVIGSDGFKKYVEAMKEYDNIEHDVDIFTVSPSVLNDSQLNANDIMNIEFMFEE